MNNIQKLFSTNFKLTKLTKITLKFYILFPRHNKQVTSLSLLDFFKLLLFV